MSVVGALFQMIVAVFEVRFLGGKMEVAVATTVSVPALLPVYMKVALPVASAVPVPVWALAPVTVKVTTIPAGLTTLMS